MKKKITIFQIKDIETCDYAFRDFHAAQKHNFKLADYKPVYSDEVSFEGGESDLQFCEDLYELFNMASPEYRDSIDYTGHSLSVSDIICINELDESRPRFFYCDNFGFKNISEFI